MIELTDDRRVLYQWELNKRIIIDGFPAGTIVEFSRLHDCKDSSIPVLSYEENGRVYANVPNCLLKQPCTIHVFVRPSASDTENQPQQKCIRVVREEKPEDYDDNYSETEVFSYKNLEEKVKLIEREMKELERKVESSVTGGSTLRVAEVTLLEALWIGDKSPYYQVVTIAGVTEYSQVDLTPSVEQLVVFHEKDLTLVTENDDGVVTVYAIGKKPTNDYIIQATVKEVSV